MKQVAKYTIWVPQISLIDTLSEVLPYKVCLWIEICKFSQDSEKALDL